MGEPLSMCDNGIVVELSATQESPPQPQPLGPFSLCSARQHHHLSPTRNLFFVSLAPVFYYTVPSRKQLPLINAPFLFKKQLTAIASSNLNATRRESGTRVYTRTRQSMSTTKPINPWNSNGVRHFRTVPTNKGIKSNKNTQSQRSAQFSSHRKQVNQRESLSYFFLCCSFFFFFPTE